MIAPMKIPDPVRRPATNTNDEVAKLLLRPALHGARPWQVALASAIAVLVMVALMLLTSARANIASRVATPLAEKLEGADRVAYYIIPELQEDGPSFRLGPTDESIKLITHLVLPPGHTYEPSEDYSYGIHLTLEGLDGEVQWEHEVNIRTRQSKSEGTRYGWRHENAFVLEERSSRLFGGGEPTEGGQVREISDDRLTRVRLPKGEGDRRLRLSFVPREPNVGVLGLARMYVRRPRAVDDRTLRELSLAPEAAEDLVDHLTYRDWEQLSEEERRQKLSYLWERASAEGEIGTDYEIMSIYETGFRLPRDTKTDERRLIVTGARSMAVNVMGPAELQLELFTDLSRGTVAPRGGEGEGEGEDGNEGEGEAPAAYVSSAEQRLLDLEIYMRNLDGTEDAFPRSLARSRTLEIPEGVHTLILESEEMLEFTLEVAEAQEERVWLIEAERPMRLDEDGNEVLQPDMRRIQTVHVGEDWEVTPRWVIEGPDDPVSRMLRFDARVIHPYAWNWWPDDSKAPKPKLELCFYTESGKRLRCENWRGYPAVESHFEGLELADQEQAQQSARKRQTRWYAVSEPQTWRTVAPQGTRYVELHAADNAPDQRLIVRAYGYWPEAETIVGLPFRIYQSEQMIWRYPPLDTRTWFPMRPTNYDDLQDDEAIADLHAQVRLQPRGPGGGRGRGPRNPYGEPNADDRIADELMGPDGWDPGPWVTLQPRGIHRRRSILEELDPAAGRRFSERWDGSLFAELWPGRRQPVDFGAIGPGAPHLHWQVDPRLLGQEVELIVDGRSYTEQLMETRGRWQLPIEDGRRQVELKLDADKNEYDVWIDRPVMVGEQPVSRRRVVHELTTRLEFPLIKRGPEALTVNVVMYVLRRRERVELALQIDDGQPERREGEIIERFSRADRSFTIDSLGVYDENDRELDLRRKIRFVDLESNNTLPIEVVTVQITLGEDILPGAHEVSIELLDGGRVWTRAFHRGIADRSKAAASWSEASSGPFPSLEEEEQP